MAELEGKIGFTTQTSRVRVGVKFMKNLGNFENVTLDFAFEEDARDGETLEEAEARLWELANVTLAKRLKEILSDRERTKRGKHE